MALLGFNRSKAYLIGISDYVFPIKKLSTPVKDINAIEEAFCDFDSVTKKIDITRSDFETFLKEMVAEVNSSGTDRVLFYFAGHGTTINNTRGPQGFLILKNDANDENSGNYKIEDLLTHLSELTCKHLLIVLDCCFAGAVQWDINKRAAGRKHEEKITDPLYRIFSENNAWQIITSAAANQEALNSYNQPVSKFWGDSLRNEESDNSPFAIQFINALKGVGKEVFFAENIITANRLYTYISENLIKDLDEKDIDHEQVPGLFSLLKHKNGQFIFSFKNEEPVFAKTPEFENPYRGFDSYTEKDSEVFFGRDKLIADFKKDAIRFNNFFIVGPSGIGKSSLVKAGFVSYLLSQTNNTAFHLFRPTTFDFTGTETWKKKLCDPNGEKHILFFDQFEEAIGLDADNQKKLAEIIECGRSASTVFLFIAIRSDKSKRILENPIFDWGRFKTILFSFPGNTDIEDIIVKPALRQATVIRAAINKNKSEREIDIKADDNFINSIIQDYKEPGSLPFLSTALHEWFKSVGQYDDPRLLKQDDWGKSGSIEEVFNAKMKRIEDGMEDKYVFRRLMFRLLDYFENSPVRKQLARKYTQPEDKALLKKLEDERIIRYPDDRAENDPERLIEFAHDSIIEKWLIQQDWFKERVTKARNNIADLVRAQNYLVPDVMIWRKSCKKKDLWNHEEELPKIKRDIEVVPTKDKIWDHIMNTIGAPANMNVPEKTYFTGPEVEFIQQSVKKNKIGAKFVHRIWMIIICLSSLAIGLIYNANLKTKKQAAVNLARSYAEKSSTFGETEALYLLKEAEKLSPNDPHIESKFYELFNERDYIGNPFAIAVTNIETGLDNISWDQAKKKIFLYNNLKDSIEWDYAETGAQRKHFNPTALKIKNVMKANSYLVAEHEFFDTIKFDGETITDFAISEFRDSIYAITRQDRMGPYLAICNLYSYSAKTRIKKLVLRKDDGNGTGILQFSPLKKYVHINRNDEISFYNLKGDSIAGLPYDDVFPGKILFNQHENKVLVEFNEYRKWGPDGCSVELYDFKTKEHSILPKVLFNVEENFIFKDDTTIVYFSNTVDSEKVASYLEYTEYNTNNKTWRQKGVFASNNFYFPRSLLSVQLNKNLLLLDDRNKKFVVTDSIMGVPLNYDGNYVGHEIVTDGPNTLLLIKSLRLNLYNYTLYNITEAPKLIHKSSFSYPLKRISCQGRLSILIMEFEPGLLAVYDLKASFKIKNQVTFNDDIRGFVEIAPDSFAFLAESYVFPFCNNIVGPLFKFRVIAKNKNYLLDNLDDEDNDVESDTASLYDFKTGKFTTIYSDSEKLKTLFILTGFRFKKSGDSAFINMEGNTWRRIFPRTEYESYDYFKTLSNSNEYFFNYPYYIKIEAHNLVLKTPEKKPGYLFDEIKDSDPYSTFSDIAMPSKTVVTGIVFDSVEQRRRFFYWDILTNKKTFHNCSEAFVKDLGNSCSAYFSLPGTSQILYADNNKIVLYDHKEEKIIYSHPKRSEVKHVFRLSDNLRYLLVDSDRNIFSEFLPQKIKEFAYAIKSPDLAYLK